MQLHRKRGRLESTGQVGVRCRVPQAALLRKLNRTRALATQAVEVLVGSNSFLSASLKPRSRQRGVGPVGRDMLRTAYATLGGRACFVVLQPPKIGQHALVVPAGIAQRGPVVVVRRMAAHEHHPVDRAAASQALAGRPLIGASAAGGVAPHRVHPVETGIEDRLAAGGRKPHIRMAAGTPGLQQQHGTGCRQP